MSGGGALTAIATICGLGALVWFAVEAAEARQRALDLDPPLKRDIAA